MNPLPSPFSARHPRASALLIALLLAVLPAAAPAVAQSASPDDLFAAARAGDVAAVEAALAAGVPIDATDRYGSTALIMAAGRGELAVVEALLAAGADTDRTEGFYGSGALGQALFNGHPEVAAALLAAGAEGREQALGFALSRRLPELARAAVASGPLYASALADARGQALHLGGEYATLLADAESRPDPPPPELTRADLEPLTGDFEGVVSETRVLVAIDGEGRLTAAVDGDAPVALAPVAALSFRSADGAVGASFFGRAGTIEGLQLNRGDGPPDSLRRTVAVPVPDAAPRAAATGGDDEAGDGAPDDRPATVHWPSFRGADAAGIGDGAPTPTAWNVDSGEGVLWQAELPGLGNSSPVVWGDKVFVTTAVAESIEQGIRTGLTGEGTTIDAELEAEHSWRVLAFDKDDGSALWSTEVGRAKPLTSRHFKATQANSTPATDGRYLVAVFPTAGLVCLDLDGEVLWRQQLGGLNAGAFNDPGIEWGYASSPILYRDTVILQVDTHDERYIAAWELATGEQRWRSDREVAPSWATPTVVAGPEGDELVVNGSTIVAYDPTDGAELWRFGPNSELVIATPIAGDGVVYVSAGYPPVKPVYAVKTGRRGAFEAKPGEEHPRLAWSHRIGGAYMPTPLLYRDLLYIVHHNGRLVVYRAGDGTPIHKSRFSQGGVFTASPVAADGKLYMGTEEGLVYVLKAGGEFGELAVNDLGEPLMATPAISEGLLLLRTPSRLLAVGAAPEDGDAAARSSD